MGFLAEFLTSTPNQIETSQLEKLRDKLLVDGKSPQTVKHVLGILQRVIRFGAKRGLCELPANLFFPHPHIDNKVTENLTPAQVKKLLQVLDEDYDQELANLMRLALFTGARKTALLALEWADIDFTRNFIVLRGLSAKNKRTATIPMSAPVRDILESMRHTKSPFLFPGRNGGRRTSTQNFTRRIAKAAGFPEGFRPLHGLRHVYASWLASSGQVDLYTLQRLLTHESPTMTARYAHLADEALRRAADVSAKVFDLQE